MAAAPARAATKKVLARNAALPETRALPATHARQAAHAPERWCLAESWAAAAQGWVQPPSQTWPARPQVWRAASQHRRAAVWAVAEWPRSSAARLRQRPPDNWPSRRPHRSRQCSANARSWRWRAEARARCDGSLRKYLQKSAPAFCRHRYCPEHRPPRSAKRLQRGRPPSMTSAAAQSILLNSSSSQLDPGSTRSRQLRTLQPGPLGAYPILPCNQLALHNTPQAMHIAGMTELCSN